MSNQGVFYLIDPYFSGEPGHAMNFGGGVTQAASELNIKMKMAVSNEIQLAAAQSYNALPIFSIGASLKKCRYEEPTADIEKFIASYLDDLNKFSRYLTCNDVLWDYYLQGPMQVDIYSRWLEALPIEKRPKVMVGVDVFYGLWYRWLDPIADRIKQLEPWFRVTSTSFTNTKKLTDQLGIRAQWMPRPKMARIASSAGRDEDMASALSADNKGIEQPLVGFFADPVEVKSFHLLGPCVQRLLEKTNIRFVIQLRGEPEEETCIESLRQLREAQELYPARVVFVPGMLEYNAYKTALELCDGVLIAYDPTSHFADTPSGTVCEALAAGTVPLAIEGTSMDKEMRLFDIDIPVMKEQAEDNMHELLYAFAHHHDEWIKRNQGRIDKWNQFQSHENMFEHLFVNAWN